MSLCFLVSQIQFVGGLKRVLDRLLHDLGLESASCIFVLGTPDSSYALFVVDLFATDKHLGLFLYSHMRVLCSILLPYLSRQRVSLAPWQFDLKVVLLLLYLYRAHQLVN